MLCLWQSDIETRRTKMPTPGILIVGAAVAAKVFSFGWLVSIATSRRFLDHSTEALDNLVELGKGPEEAQLATLRSDIALLEKHIKEGWAETHVFAAASRVSTWKFVIHVQGAVSGGARLAGNGISAAKGWMFPERPPPPDLPR